MYVCKRVYNEIIMGNGFPFMKAISFPFQSFPIYSKGVRINLLMFILAQNFEISTVLWPYTFFCAPIDLLKVENAYDI